MIPVIVLHAVANLPYGVTEEMLLDVFKEVGPVKSIRYNRRPDLHS